MRTSVLAAAALLLAAAPAPADLDARAALGFDGRWVADAATPLGVSLTNSGAEAIDVQITVFQGEALAPEETVHHRVVRLAPQASRDESFVVRGPQQWRRDVHVRLDVDPVVPIHAGAVSGDRGTLTFDVAGGGAMSADDVPYASHVIGVVGDSAGRVAAAVRRLGFSEDDQRELRACDRVEFLGVAPEQLRLAPLGLDGVDTLVLCDPDARTLSDPVAAEGLLDWVALGGRLVVSLGEHAAEFASSSVAREMPATWLGAEKVSYGDLVGALGATAGPDAYVGPWTALAPTESAEQKEPEISTSTPAVTRAFGDGRVALLPYDLRTLLGGPWLREKDARTLLLPVVRLPSKNRPPEDTTEGWRRSDFSNGIAQTLRTNAFDPPPLPLVVLGIVLYVVVVGPLDWFVLKRLKKERLTTLTFLGAVLSFTVLAYGASLLLFSKGARVNRVVFADVVDAGRGGRQLLRFMDVAGYYSPNGADRSLAFAAPTILLPAGLPGSGAFGGVGAAMPVRCSGPDALHPAVQVQLAFRSQRVVRTASVATIGASLDVEWEKGGDGVRVVNGLPVSFDEVVVYRGTGAVYSLGAVAAGRTTSFERATDSWNGRFADMAPDDWSNGRPVTAAKARQLLEAVTVGAWLKRGAAGDDRATMRKAGLERSSVLEDERRALLVAFSSKFPVELPGSEAAGDTYVVLRKEVERP